MNDTEQQYIDFVIPWVDGSDPAWVREFLKYKNIGSAVSESAVDTTIERYRDWGLLKYWFRGVDKFAPWARRIHFITWGHLPDWLDTSNPRLNIVRHEDFIPERYLPVFSSCPIEMFLHRIEGLSNRFVYFNDDFFLCREVGEDRFFKDGMPLDEARLSIPHDDLIAHNELECLRIINRRYDKKRSIGKNLGKWFNARYSVSDMLKTLSLMPWSFFTGFKNHHSPQPFLRETFERLWREESEELEKTCLNRFRAPTDLLQWLMRYEQLARGDFKAHGYRDARLTKISDESAGDIARMVREQQYAMICINDNNELKDFEAAQRELKGAFEAILPEASSFEKQ